MYNLLINKSDYNLFYNFFSYYIKPGTVIVIVVQKHTGLKTKLY